jgi:hypothetical protein
MNITPKLRKIIYDLFDEVVKGTDKYITDSSMWLIFTDERRWILEFTNLKTLWFNYNIFQTQMSFLSMDCINHKEIIKEWFESRFLEEEINHVTDISNVPYLIIDRVVRNGVKETDGDSSPLVDIVEETIENGVKETIENRLYRTASVMTTIQNGVKDTPQPCIQHSRSVEDAIQNGVKEVEKGSWFNVMCAEDVIQNGVKNTELHKGVRLFAIRDAMENGVKEVKENYLGHIDCKETCATSFEFSSRVDNVLENGVKEIKTDLKNPQSYHHKWTIDDIVENGVKEIKELPDKSGEYRGFSDYYFRQENRTKPFDLYIDEAIKNGVKN